ncbi:MAG: glycerol kinase GlpK [Alphaproteobacteria bacterium]|nr:glycerol kinase GlpK [Alphaproteobacteria bacterium]MDE2630446.1 glycerol kinase GlpK [Alphaproteobacteria bacterium]
MTTEPPFLLSIDQGTTSTRAILFDAGGTPLASHSIALRQIYPGNAWVEHDADEIWQSALTCCRIVARGIAAKDIAGIGITNQRETTLIWDRKTGRAIHNAIVWQDRRTAERCHRLRAMGLESKIAAKTGLVLDPYFSATKAEWLLDNVAGARERAGKGELAFGTVDSWLIYKLTDGALHATDTTNASRTMLLDLKTLFWNDDLLTLFDIPRPLLPEVRDSAGDFGATAPDIFGAPIRILGVAGDQQAAAIGQACFTPGDVKSTYGTGCFALVNTGVAVPSSQNRLLATNAYRIGGKAAYAVEGSIFVAGAVVQWLRDALGVIRSADEVEALARAAKRAGGLYFVPAFTGLGAPYWDPDARGAILGLTRDMSAAEIARAALDAVCYQTRDLLEAMARDMRTAGLGAPSALKVDGGMVGNDWFCQRLADLAGLPVERPKIVETTALGAAYLAGLAAGLFHDTDDIAARWALDRRFEPSLAASSRDALYEGWNAAVARIRAV